MNVNTRAAHDATVTRMSGLQRELDTLQGRIATGKRLAVPSDDPVASGIASRLTRSQALNTAQVRALDAASSRLAAADTALGGVGTLLIRARELALAGASATLSASDRATLATEVAGLGDDLLAFANTLGPDGAPLFGNALGRGPAFARDATGAVAWRGSGEPSRVAGLAAGIDGRAAFTGSDADAFALLDDLAAALVAPDLTRDADLAAVLTGLDAAVSRTADARAGVGIRAARVDSGVEHLRAGNVALETDIAKLTGLDMAAAIARLQRLTTVLQAAQASFVKVAGLSLWDRL